jgi:acetolactate synthase-1/2/3 large subunit
MTTVGVRLVEGLAARGVTTVFGIPGVHTIELYRGLAGGALRHVTPRHEQGAAFMADGHARMTGRPGVAFVITGPGLTNALTAMAQARADSVPVLVVSGVNRRDSLGRGLGHLHELPDQGAMVRTLCPSFRVEGAEMLGPVLDAAFAAMLGGRPGPAHVEVPTDVMPLPCPPLPPPAAPRARPAPDAGPLAAHLAGARAPLILAGGGARAAGAALARVARALDAPVVLTTNARGLMHGDPLVVPASPSLAPVRALVAGSDRVLAVGTELGPTDYDMYADGAGPDLSGMARIDICPAQLARHPAALTLCAEADTALAALATALAADPATALPPARAPGAGAARAAAARTAARAALPGLHPAFPLQLALVEAIRDAMPGTPIVGDSTQPVYAGNLYLDHDCPGGWFNAATGYGALGYGPGAAVGAAVARGGPVVCLVGDGGLQFAPAELRTSVDEGLPITWIVWNNAGYREIAEAMAGAGTAVVGCTPSPFDHAALAAACGLAHAAVPCTPRALAEALAAPAPAGPRLIEVRAP